MMTIHEVSKLAGVSVRTLHHYDATGLLPPTALTEAGYRLYDDTALARLQSILLFRELEFPLKDIKRILDDPNFDQAAALEDQIKLLELRRKQLRKLIALARETLKTGVIPMKFDAFDKTEQARFAAEVKEKWGGTAAYQEYQQREKDGSAGDETRSSPGLLRRKEMKMTAAITISVKMSFLTMFFLPETVINIIEDG